VKTIQTYQPEKLIVLRDGLVDDEYYDQIYSERRRIALTKAGREMLRFTFITAPVQIGKGIVYLLSHDPEQVKD
jgi:hypothetical protein